MSKIVIQYLDSCTLILPEVVGHSAAVRLSGALYIIRWLKRFSLFLTKYYKLHFRWKTFFFSSDNVSVYNICYNTISDRYLIYYRIFRDSQFHYFSYIWTSLYGRGRIHTQFCTTLLSKCYSDFTYCQNVHLFTR